MSVYEKSSDEIVLELLLASFRVRYNGLSSSIGSGPWKRLKTGPVTLFASCDLAEVAELADALGSGPSGLTMPVEVQVLSSALVGNGLRANRSNTTPLSPRA